MEKDLYRKSTLEKFSSPEQLDRYLRVTSPGIWTVLLAVILLLVLQQNRRKGRAECPALFRRMKKRSPSGLLFCRGD